jgi:predicted nucleic acid-binding protein
LFKFLLDSEAAKIAGKIRTDLAARGTPIGSYDVQIAAIALANDLILVTHNTREFARVSGCFLKIGSNKVELDFKNYVNRL